MSEVPAHDPGGLTEADLGPDPIARLVAWLDEARNAGVRFPEAAALATADPDGAPAVRHVLIKVVDERGLTFFTNRESRKGRQLAENPNVGLAFYWRELDRQVCVTGGASFVDDAESDEYFQSRPLQSRIGAWTSRQSAPLASRDALEKELAANQLRFGDGPVPLPDYWGGYRVIPDEVEFWQGRANRLHDRIAFRRESGEWHKRRLSP